MQIQDQGSCGNGCGWDLVVIPSDSSTKACFDIIVAFCVLFTAITVPIELAYQAHHAAACIILCPLSAWHAPHH